MIVVQTGKEVKNTFMGGCFFGMIVMVAFFVAVFFFFAQAAENDWSSNENPSEDNLWDPVEPDLGKKPVPTRTHPGSDGDKGGWGRY